MSLSDKSVSASSKAILAMTAHRPWALPKRSWVLAQSWSRLLFAHWRLDPAQIAALIPAGLELDTFDGAAWIGVVPFYMSNVHPRWTFNVPGLSAFPELNVRTYVTRDGKPGVWFFSLDAANRVAVKAARYFARLPYYHADMELHTQTDWIVYRSQRFHASAAFEACYRPTSPIFYAQPGTLDHWLTERYCLYTADARGRLYRCEVHHPQWSLQRAEAKISTNTIAQASGITLPDDPPLLHYSQRLDVLTWYLERLK